MTYPEAKQVLTELLDAFDRDEHGDYFYDNGWEVREAVILAMGAFQDNLVAVTRCKDCGHRKESTHHKGQDYCPMWGAVGLNPDGFCNMGKPKEET